MGVHLIQRMLRVVMRKNIQNINIKMNYPTFRIVHLAYYIV